MENARGRHRFDMAAPVHKSLIGAGPMYLWLALPSREIDADDRGFKALEATACRHITDIFDVRFPGFS